MADTEVNHKESEESVNPSTSNPDRSGPSNSKASSSLPGPSLSGPGPHAANSSTSEGKASNYFASLDTSVEALQSRAQSLINSINEDRIKDQTMMKNFNTSLNIKVAEMSQRLEDKMYQMYEQNNTQLQIRLQEFTETIDRIEQLQAELKQVCQTVVTVYKDLGLQHTG
ncbi:synaptonemal complex central element protein 2 [Leptodactylus fuscus]|uniref:synaptonemal complex central element protein 2 n=1 Tax=Leptodactylus fuscus TaxID=238119 RepID=UPI003F4E80D4